MVAVGRNLRRCRQRPGDLADQSVQRRIYAASILAELTTTAAFVALLVFVPAMAGVFAGRLLVDRKHKEHAALQQSDTDVFQAVQEEADATK